MTVAITQEREAVVVEGVTFYEIHTVVSDQGEFVDNGFFLMQVSDVDDPKTDIFLRVVGLGDLGTYVADRDAAIEDESLIYRSAEFVRRYRSLDTAVAAKRIIKDQVDALDGNFTKYTNNFVTAGEITTFPLVDLTLLKELIDAYEAAKTTLEAAQEAETDATAAVVEITVAKTAAETAVATYANVISVLNTLDSSLNDLVTATQGLGSVVAAIGDDPPSGFGVAADEGSTFLKTLNNFLVDIDTQLDAISARISSGDVSDSVAISAYLSLVALRTTFISAANVFNTVISSYAGAVLTDGLAAILHVVDTSSILTAQAAAAAANAALTAQLSAAVSASITATATAAQAQIDADAALAAVVAACPDFDPEDPDASLET